MTLDPYRWWYWLAVAFLALVPLAVIFLHPGYRFSFPKRSHRAESVWIPR